MRLPEVADRLRELSKEHDIHELELLAAFMARRSPLNRAPKTCRSMTPKLKEEIHQYAVSHPTLTQLQIGNRFNVNPGRVSEILRGYRT